MVAVDDGFIVTNDGLGTELRLPMASLRRVVVATDDSGPWGVDVVFLLYSSEAAPVGIFPLEATGVQNFIDWLQRLPGYHDRELAKAMSSTEVARFVVYDAQA